MKFHSFLIKYGEIGIKGKNRYIFEDALVRQIQLCSAGRRRRISCTQMSRKSLRGL